jgi:flagellar biosynthesis protein FlhA
MSDYKGKNRFFYKQFIKTCSVLGVASLVLMLIIPLPTILLDILMVMYLVSCLLILLIVIRTKKAINFTLFPTALLILSLFGLLLNIASTRLILINGADFNSRFIRALSKFIVGSGDIGSLVIGTAIFIVVVAVQVIFITKGATRVAEVATRFILDALPGKQMAIEAEFNSGGIAEEESFARKKELQQEADFYGALDGAVKFISSNFKVGIVITALTILIGILIGVNIHGEPIADTVGNYISFAIGASLLITQIPFTLISTVSGIVVTRRLEYAK